MSSHDPIVIAGAARTPMGAFQGALKGALGGRGGEASQIGGIKSLGAGVSPPVSDRHRLVRPPSEPACHRACLARHSTRCAAQA